MHHLTATAFSTPPVAAYADFDRLYLKAMRLWVLFARSGRSPRAPLAALLGDRAAARFSMLMEACVVAWPEPFTTFPPCACLCSPDESTLMALLATAETASPERAHALLADMLPFADRARLWNAAVRCVASESERPR